jgi:hypothetical protein
MTNSPIGASPASLPTRTPEELESLLSLALGALERIEKIDSFTDRFGTYSGQAARIASQVIAQIKESMASSARNEPQAGLAP